MPSASPTCHPVDVRQRLMSYTSSDLRSTAARERSATCLAAADHGLVVRPGVDVERDPARPPAPPRPRPRARRASARPPCRRAASAGRRTPRARTRTGARGRRRSGRRRSGRRRARRAARARSPGTTPGWSPSMSTSTSRRGSSASIATAIDDEQPAPKPGLTTTSAPDRSTRARTFSALTADAPPAAGRTRTRARCATVWSSSVAPPYGSSCFGPAEPARAARRQDESRDERITHGSNGPRGACVVRRPAAATPARAAIATISARIDSAISSGVRAPMSRPAGVCTRARSSSETSRLSDDRLAAPAARHQADVGDADVERGGQRVLLVAAVRGDDERGVVGRGGSPPACDDVVAERRPSSASALRDRRVADHVHARGAGRAARGRSRARRR